MAVIEQAWVKLEMLIVIAMLKTLQTVLVTEANRCLYCLFHIPAIP